MMKNNIFFLFFLIITVKGFSQTAVSGLVIDGEFNEPLAFANVVLRLKGSTETSAGTITDFDGRYTILIDQSGLYELEFSYLGYETIVISDVELVDRNETEISVTLNPAANALEEVVVTTTVRKNNEASVLAIQKGAVTLLDGLSAQTIRKSGDGNVASAIKRIPGVSVQGGKFVYVRGLGDRYSKTLLGGLEVPGLDPDRNTLQLDIFPTNLLDNILVSKSASADKGADFTGGIVDVILRDFSTLPEYSISVSSGYNSITSFKEAPSLPDYSLNSLFFDSGVNDLPFASNTSIPLPDVFMSPADEQILINATNSLTKQLAVSRENNLLDLSIGVTASNQFKIGDKSALGYIASIGYKYDSDYYERIYNSTVSKEPIGLELFNSQEGEMGSIQAIANGLFGLSFKSGKTKHKASVLAIQSGESNAIDGVIQDYLENPYYGLANIMTHTQRTIMSFPVSGEYDLGSKFRLDWKVAPSIVSVQDIDFRKTVFDQRSNGVLLINNSTTNFPQRLWRNLDETGLSGKFNFEYEFKAGAIEGKVKTGASYLLKSRDFNTDNFRVGYVGPSSELNGDYNKILNPNTIWNSNKNVGSYIRGEFQPTDQYESKGETIGSYLSTELKFSEHFKSILGIRYEAYSTTYTGQNIEREVFNNATFIDVADLFPSANLIYSFSEDKNLRVSYSKTTARPSFKENSAAQIYDPITERFFLGNTDLIPTYIDNLDLRWEKYGEGNQITALSVFYKKFVDPIEIFYYSITAPNVLIGRNNEEASVYGAEFEFRNNILENELKRLSININASYIISELTMSDQEYEGRKVNEPERDINRVRQLQGQSPYLINAGLSYNLFDKDLEAGAYYNVQGKALQVIGIGQFPDVYTEPFHSLNINVSKRFGEKKNTTVSLKVDNLLNDVIESRFDYFGNTEFLFSSLKPGVNTTLGVSFKF